MVKRGRYSPEVRERAVRLVLEQQDSYASQSAAMVSVAEKIGCTPETLRKWVRFAERQQIPEERARLIEQQRVKELEREVRELKQAKRDKAKRDDIIQETERRLAELEQMKGEAHSKAACDLRAHGTFDRRRPACSGSIRAQDRC